MRHLLAAVMLQVPLGLFAQEIRPVRDDIGFCWDLTQMERMISHLETQTVMSDSIEPWIGGISPHDDYLYAARIYYPLFASLRAREVVIFGVTHRTVRNEIGDPRNCIILDDYRSWTGIRGEVPISPLRQFILQRLDSTYFRVDRTAHRLEHSIEALIPFLQYYRPDIRITPIMVTAMNGEDMRRLAETLAGIIAEYIREERLAVGPDIAFLISSDANHYGGDFSNTPFGEDENAHREGTEQDLRLVQRYLTGSITMEKIGWLTEELGRVVWCGRYSIPFGMMTTLLTVRRCLGAGITGTLLRYSDTYSEGVLPLTRTGMGTTAPFSLKHWVGFFSIGFRTR